MGTATWKVPEARVKMGCRESTKMEWRRKLLRVHFQEKGAGIKELNKRIPKSQCEER